MGIQRGFEEELHSVARFEEAIAKDPSFAPAFAGLVAAHLARSGTDQFDFADEVVKMEGTAEKAFELDPLLAEAQGALGMAYARAAQMATVGE